MEYITFLEASTIILYFMTGYFYAHYMKEHYELPIPFISVVTVFWPILMACHIIKNVFLPEK